jgi:fumarate reductase subunit C
VQISTGSLPSTPSDEKKAGYLDSFMKNSVIVVVALILLVFGLWILLAPTVKPMIVDASKAAAA